MDSVPPLPVGPGQRMLAAIVFTDVVGYSALMQEAEDETLRLLERDFAVMRKLCEKHEGFVLKTTGDGLLLHFSSAVLAVAFAQKMQRGLAETAKDLPPDEILRHRVGIHLGDVFVNHDDVLGDGVNIAARLQAEAEPGGICISQTVYDVVNHKLELDVVKLGPRELKNILQAVPMYRVVLDAPKSGRFPAGAAADVYRGPAPPPPFAPTGRQKLAAWLVLVVVLGAGGALVVRTHLQQEEELVRSQETRALLQEKTTSPGSAAAKPDPEADKAASGTTGSREYDFAAMAGDPAKQPVPSAMELAEIRAQARERMQVLFSWLDAVIPHYTKEKPLLVRDLPGLSAQETKVFFGPDRHVYLAEGGAVRQRNWADLKPTVLGGVITSALLDTPLPPPREVIKGAEAFAWQYSLPAVIEVLRAGHLNGAAP